MGATAGSLMRLVLGNDSISRENKIEPIYHDIIQQKILRAFNLDTSVITTTRTDEEF